MKRTSSITWTETFRIRIWLSDLPSETTLAELMSCSLESSTPPLEMDSIQRQLRYISHNITSFIFNCNFHKNFPLLAVNRYYYISALFGNLNLKYSVQSYLKQFSFFVSLTATKTICYERPLLTVEKNSLVMLLLLVEKMHKICG